MKPRVQTYADPADVYGSELNEWQDATVEERFADGCTTGVPAGWTAPGTIAARRIGAVRLVILNYCIGGAVETVLDASENWMDCYLDRTWLAGEDVSTKMPGGTAYAAAATYPLVELDGYTGQGCTAAIPPTIIGGGTAGVGEYWTPWANFYLYVRAPDGALCVYNNIGASPGGDVYLWGVVGLSGDIGVF